MTMLLTGTEVYVAQLDSIAGWFSLVDVLMFNDILRHQLEPTYVGAPGDLLEIGCFMGKSAILLGYGQGENSLVVCDIFGDPDLHDCEACTDHPMYRAATADRFCANWDLYHPVRPEAFACDSQHLEPRIAQRSFRFIHVDACHNYRCVQSDITLAVSHAAPGCVVALDDYRATQLPGVGAAVWQAVCFGLLFPFAVSDAKLYACVSANEARYWLDRLRGRGTTCAFPDYEVLVLPSG